MERTQCGRRDFLKRGAVAVGMPYFVPSHALGRAGSAAPSDRVTLGFIGLGNRAFRWANAKLLNSSVDLPGCRVLAVCDVDRTRCQAAKEYVDSAYGTSNCAAYRDFRAMLVRKDIDAVVIATPHHWHGVMTIMACRHGKDVYCEKPLSQTIREARAMAKAAKRHNRVVQAGTQARSSPLIRHACEVIQQGGIGKVQQVLVGCWGQARDVEVEPEPVPEYLDWELFVGPAPMCPYSSKVRWYMRREFSGGTITDHGHHYFDIASWGLSMDNSGPVEVFPADGKDHEFVTLKCASGVGVMLHAKDGKALSQGTTFIGSAGKIWMHAWNDQVVFEPELAERYPYPGLKAMGNVSEEAVKPSGRFSNDLSTAHIKNFLECVRTRKRPNADVAISRYSVMLPHLTNIVLWAGRGLNWNPDKEEFVNDASANRYLHIPPRKPWKV